MTKLSAVVLTVVKLQATPVVQTHNSVIRNYAPSAPVNVLTATSKGEAEGMT